jgi:hypothetical protein
MTIALIILAWYALGLLGSALALYFGFLRDGLDVDVGDCILGAVMALAGPCNLIAGLVFLLGWVLRGHGLNSRRIVFRASGRR